MEAVEYHYAGQNTFSPEEPLQHQAQATLNGVERSQRLIWREPFDSMLARTA